MSFSAIRMASRTTLPQSLDDTEPQPSRDTLSSTPKRLAISYLSASDINPCFDISKPPMLRSIYRTHNFPETSYIILTIIDINVISYGIFQFSQFHNAIYE